MPAAALSGWLGTARPTRPKRRPLSILDVAVVGGAVDVLAMTVEGGTAGEELPHAVTPTSPAAFITRPGPGDDGHDGHSIRSVSFMRSP